MQNSERFLNPIHLNGSPDSPFTITESRVRSRLDTLLEVASLKHALLRRKLAAGDTIAVYAANSPELIALIFACFELSIRIALLNPRLSASVLAKQVQAANAVALISDAGCQFTSVTQYHLEELVQENAAGAFEPQEWNLTTEALIVFTSGSEGEPKGVVHTLSSLLFAAQASNSVSGFNSSDTWLLSLPLYHLGGFQILLRTAVGGGCLSLVPAQDTSSLLAALNHSPVTFLSLVPTQLQALLDEIDLAEFKTRGGKILLAGAPSSSELLARLAALQITVIPCYGMTETAAHCTALEAPFDIKKIHTVGKALPGTRVTVCDSSGASLPAGQAGRIYIDTPQLAVAYLALDGSQQKISNPFQTADLGMYDSEGDQHIKGRADRVLISGGENISALEIENEIYRSGIVQLAAILPVADTRWGERPLLYVVLKAGAEESELANYIEQSLPKLHKPAKVFYRSELPLTAIGKVDYPALAQESATLHSPE